LVLYKLKTGKEIETGRSKGWCYSCRDYVDVEDVNLNQFREKHKEKDQERREIKNHCDELTKGFFTSLLNKKKLIKMRHSVEMLDQEIKDLAALSEMVGNRKSKARCLTCWSDNTVHLTFDSEDHLSHDFRHECGGQLKFVPEPSGMRFNMSLTTYVLNEEGELLEER
jgi:hypothetical protein